MAPSEKKATKSAEKISLRMRNLFNIYFIMIRFLFDALSLSFSISSSFIIAIVLIMFVILLRCYLHYSILLHLPFSKCLEFKMDAINLDEVYVSNVHTNSIGGFFQKLDLENSIEIDEGPIERREKISRNMLAEIYELRIQLAYLCQ